MLLFFLKLWVFFFLVLLLGIGIFATLEVVAMTKEYIKDTKKRILYRCHY